MVAIAITTIVAALLTAFGLWIRKLYQERDHVPELRASLKVTADRRDELAQDLAIERSAHAADRAALDRMTHSFTSLAAVLRKETDARIRTNPDDGDAQRRITDELLERGWPLASVTPTGADGDRPGGATETVRSPGAARPSSITGR